eukprot:Phypoly_transcript_01441.p1 GENE.Phypoly_transcript_01441~~Phypoly_transcript_01441.p1  ORF type:complete len:1034 (+),score=181.95 Phypoly_transcript_01441:244-3345(+)
MVTMSFALTDQQVRSDLAACPKWVLYKLKEAIYVKQSIESEWETAREDFARCKQDLLRRFQKALQKIGEQKEERDRELLQKRLELEQKEFDIQVWKDTSEKYQKHELKLRDEKIEEKQHRVEALEEEVGQMANELAQKDFQLQKATQQIAEMKAQTDIDAESLLLLEHDTRKLQNAEAEIERLAKEVQRLEAELELRVSHNDYESAFEEAERENAELRKNLHDQASRIQELTLMRQQRETKKDESASRALLEDLKKANAKALQLEEELALQRLSELELKEIMEGIEKEAKKLSDELWLKDTEVGRLREEKEKLGVELDRAIKSAQLAGKVNEVRMRAESAPKPRAHTNVYSPSEAGAQKKGGLHALEDEELFNVIALGKHESWRPNIKAKSCKLAWLDANAKMDVLSRILLKDDLTLVNGLRSVAEPEEEVGIAMALLHLFVAHNKESILLRNFIRKDVQNTEQFSDVFKINTLTSKVLSGYSTIVSEQYLKKALRPILVDIIAQNQSFELDQGGRTSELVNTVRNMLAALRASLSYCPQQLYNLSGILWHEVGKKFTDEERYRALAIWMFARFFAPAIFSPPDFFELGEINKDSKRGLVLITRVLQSVAHGNVLKEKKLAEINSFSGEFWSSMKQFADVIRKGGDNNIVPSEVVPKMTVGEAVKTLLYVMGSKKIALINALKQQSVNPVTDTYQFKTAERLIFACVSVGVPHTGRRLTIKENDTAVEDFSNVIMEKPRILAELSPISLKMNEGDKLAQSLVIICHCRGRDEVIPEFIKEFFLRDISSHPKEPRYYDGMAARTFLPYANLIGTEFTSKMVTPLLQYCNDIKEELKPNSPTLLEAVVKFTYQINNFITQLPYSMWDICNFIHSKGRVKGPSVVTSFLFMRFFCPAIKNPEAYCFIPQEPTQVAKKNLALISESLSKIVPPTGALAKTSSIQNDPFAQLMRTEKEKIFNTIDNWLAKPTSVAPTKQQNDAPFPWSIHEEAIRYLHQLVFDNISTLAYKLGEDTASSTMTYQLGEIVDVIVATLNS